MKKLINDPADVVDAALAGMAAAHPDLRVDAKHRVVVRGDAPVPGKVGLVSGGGSGHEPLHAGFVGHGMLDAACAGEIFTSPVPDQILAATSAVDAGAGVLHIVKNYTGDVMNFDMAAELAAAETGTQIRSVVVNDDIAVRDSLYTAGRRGVGATVILEKMAGAAAESGRPLAAVAGIATRVSVESRSIGMALTSGTVPAVGHPTFELGDDEMEIGIGIHGEPGRRRVPLAPAREIAAMLVEPILTDLPFTRGDRVLCFLNGMGGTPLIELYLMFDEVARLLRGHGVEIERSLVGSYITSLDMAGCSVTLTRLDEELTALWDAPVRTPALRWGM
ncbi:dihydroxyacetone kinase subunit DhaK [Nocardia sp. SYP-A9097]|uniref:dihydroxyacetone kinase subunit DhaK n=1 Tax=Nocardia sp. SYP-A9097 TaxID=2663237 RepID=UPI00132CB0D5|nr:dihydroxyacetone kinase subunit DhaK [Nocardia sp. SYP-A9097]MRH86453.1 dihydroxyacetone kinase subunit DhaK [Nocardia sp. SYP-A9097]